jgi:hypothetical protein
MSTVDPSDTSLEHGQTADAGDTRPSLLSKSVRPLAILGGAVATPAGVALADPIMAQALAVAEGGLLTVILASALFGSARVSERAFRLLRWMANRPEPEAPKNDGGSPAR